MTSKIMLMLTWRLYYGDINYGILIKTLVRNNGGNYITYGKQCQGILDLEHRSQAFLASCMEAA